jgi:hypothetical protein
MEEALLIRCLREPFQERSTLASNLDLQEVLTSRQLVHLANPFARQPRYSDHLA